MKESVLLLMAIVALKKKLLGALLFLGAVIVPAVVCAPPV